MESTCKPSASQFTLSGESRVLSQDGEFNEAAFEGGGILIMMKNRMIKGRTKMHARGLFPTIDKDERCEMRSCAVNPT